MLWNIYICINDYYSKDVMKNTKKNSSMPKILCYVISMR